MASTYGAFERSFSPSDAIVRAMDICRQERLRISFTEVGRTLKSTLCDLVDRRGLHVPGKGKGIGEQSVASALFEALEHYYYETEDIKAKTKLHSLDLQKEDVWLRNASPDFSLLFGNQIVPLSRLPFAPLGNDGPPLLFPAFLTNPDFVSEHAAEQEAIDRLRLWRYASNSGTASGLDLWETVLHAVLELLERDAVGIALLRTIIRKDPTPVRVVMQQTLPDALLETCRLASEEAGGEITLWDVTTDLEVPVILARIAGETDSGLGYFGSGCSLSASYAAERAILEALQCFHNYTAFGVPRPSPGAYKRMSLYRRCFLEAGLFIYGGGAVAAALPEADTSTTKALAEPPRGQVTHLLRHLGSRGLAAYSRAIRDNEFHVCQIVVPKLERFHLVSYGIPVAPGARGRAALL